MGSRTQFPVFSSHLDLAHTYWAKIVCEGDIVVDATCGNGHDSCLLAQLRPKVIYAIDIQQEALQSAGKLIETHLSEAEKNKIKWLLASHEVFPVEIQEASVKLIVYNLGYLPGGDKSLVTRSDTTLRSLKQAQKLIIPGGCISMTCYPGHTEGAIEEQMLLEYTSQLDPKEWSCCLHRWLNRRQSPSLLFIQRSQRFKVN
jgi:SAM-dependent methyltransferase